VRKRKTRASEIKCDDIKSDDARDDLKSLFINAKDNEMNYSETERFNAIKLFGKPGIHNLDSLINLCVRSGIPFRERDFLAVKQGGWKGKFDSRHLLITFSHFWAAFRFSRALKYAKKHKNGFQRTRHLCLNVHTTQNRFSILDSIEVPDSFDFGPATCEPKEQHNESSRNRHRVRPEDKYWNISTLNVQSVRHVTRMRRLNTFLKKECVDLIGLTETNWKGFDLARYFPEYTWYGRKASRKSGGVGFLVRTQLLEGAQISDFKERASNDCSKEKVREVLYLWWCTVKVRQKRKQLKISGTHT